MIYKELNYLTAFNKRVLKSHSGVKGVPHSPDPKGPDSNGVPESCDPCDPDGVAAPVKDFTDGC